MVTDVTDTSPIDLQRLTMRTDAAASGAGGGLDRVKASTDVLLAESSSFLNVIKRPITLALSWLFALFAIIIAVKAWPEFIPIDGYGWLMALIGASLIAGIKWSASSAASDAFEGKPASSFRMDDAGLLCFVLSCAASANLQTQNNAESDSAWQDTLDQIDELKLESTVLKTQTTNPPRDQTVILEAKITLVGPRRPKLQWRPVNPDGARFDRWMCRQS